MTFRPALGGAKLLLPRSPSQPHTTPKRLCRRLTARGFTRSAPHVRQNPTKRAIEACECVQAGTARAACKAFHHFEDMRPLIIVRTVMMRSPPREHICLLCSSTCGYQPGALRGGWQECARGFAGVAGPASHARARERGVNGFHTTRSSRRALALSARHQANAHWLLAARLSRPRRTFPRFDSGANKNLGVFNSVPGSRFAFRNSSGTVWERGFHSRSVPVFSPAGGRRVLDPVPVSVPFLRVLF